MTNTNALPVAVVGAGYMGGGIAATFALAGHSVALADATADLATAGRERLIAEARLFVAAGLYPEDAPDVLAERLSAAPSIAAAAEGVSYISEVVSERPDIKAAVFAALSAAAAHDAVLASNTSAIPIHELARSVVHPERFLGVHWMNPAPFVPGVEIIPGPETSESVVTRATELIRGIGKVPVTVPDLPGFIANRLQYVLHRESSRLVEEGLVTADELDAVVSNSFGFRLAVFGPMAIADMAGLDVYRDTYATLEKSLGSAFSPPRYLTDLVEDGHLGLKHGGGLTAISRADPEDVATYRNRAYQQLSVLKGALGEAPAAVGGTNA
ncbi:3-hydroxyacyl-CoA dehydrogenase family protein [Microbacteriaceae bacterium VKM Ac-2855]|nr:3-hydroxyacyl-CoA dehydrogenase family protein [Microbacteriaceae bacterium VKM Ac-2855]